MYKKHKNDIMRQAKDLSNFLRSNESKLCRLSFWTCGKLIQFNWIMKSCSPSLHAIFRTRSLSTEYFLRKHISSHCVCVSVFVSVDANEIHGTSSIINLILSKNINFEFSTPNPNSMQNMDVWWQNSVWLCLWGHTLDWCDTVVHVWWWWWYKVNDVVLGIKCHMLEGSFSYYYF